MDTPLNLHDLRALAQQQLSPMAWGYYADGARDHITLDDAPRAWQRIRMRPRMLAQVGERSVARKVLGRLQDSPLVVAPMAFQGMAHADGELATARASGMAGVPMVLSTLSNQPVEQVAAASQQPTWFQLYVYKDRGATAALVQRAQAAGCSALVLTVDAPILGTREGDIRRGFHLPDHLHCANLTGTPGEALPPVAAESGLGAYFGSLLEPNLGWQDLEWLRTVTDLPILIKGVLHAQDARIARDAGVAGVVVSNHGGRQLDGAISTAQALDEIKQAVGDSLTLHVDGGIRRGSDVLKALALGAEAVWIGRPVLWGLAWAGAAGVGYVLSLLRNELDEAMALSGLSSLAVLPPDLLCGPWQGPGGGDSVGP
ncbi:MAG: alpha-hydroxy acid oxidase [Myxococcota bacterium]|nr:alpha-hydroxy acid oxidase [Myxococcota bacterium]